MQGLGWIFFILLAVALVAAYLAIRREWWRPGYVAALTIPGAVILMTMTSLGQGNSALQAIVVGLVVGGLFGAVTIGVAWYFHMQEFGPDEPYEDGEVE